MKTRTHNGSRLLSRLLAVVLVFTLTVPALAADKPQDMNRQCEDKDYRQQQRQQSASIVCSGFHFFLLFF